ncbi:uncharacterized protein BDR25DRAFT_304415 [Lindgomyces ingoldianus]|uniref:Uncharacterized protein n=1 Tax=Lindgomyces ingoldianus TaxID=673940 RepID=A0ACB6QQG8_9PLEO|nr:uncharacterized protein BDR25DRAFT_304415 [Lindgomyces ingoldianus]KAF2469239.1 hypothetical protein BDR25DRAFT_304415 [Lindgomyces ingoldianus]
MIVEDQELWNLYLKVLNSPNHDCYEAAIEDLVDYETAHILFVTWERSPDCLAAQRCLAWAKSILYDFHKVENRYLEDRDTEEMLCATLTWRMDDNDFFGTLAEAFSYLEDLPSEFDRLLLNACSRLEPVSAFVLFISAHECTHVCWNSPLLRSSCLLDFLLEKGAQFNTSGVRITPLQIAVLRWDYSGTEWLLKKGVNSNAIGDIDGKYFPHLDNRWGQASPLHIIRHSPFALDHLDKVTNGRIKQERTAQRPRIEELLLTYGAKDFLMRDSESSNALVLSATQN